MRIHGIDHGIDHGILMLHFMRIENKSGSFFGTEWNHIGSRDGGLNAIQNGLLQMLYWGCIPLGNVKSKLFHTDPCLWSSSMVKYAPVRIDSLLTHCWPYHLFVGICLCNLWTPKERFAQLLHPEI